MSKGITKALTVLILSTLLLFTGCSRTVKPPHDFRSCDWGADVSQIRQSENTATPSSDSNAMLYTDVFAGQTAVIAYHLDDGKLTGGELICLSLPNDYDSYTSLYKTLSDELRSMYGRPYSRKKLSSDSFPYKCNAYETVWQTDTSRITLAPVCDGGMPYLRVGFEPTQNDADR